MDLELNVIEARDTITEVGAENLQLIDVRTRDNFEKKSLNGFINIPANEISQKFQKLDGKKRTLLICQDGSESHRALKLLESCGFKAQVIRGGINDWTKIIGEA